MFQTLLRRCILFSIFIFLPSSLVYAEEIFKGNLYLWKRPLCLESVNCTVPQAFGSVWTTEIKINKPTQPGTATRHVVTLKQPQWTAVVTVLWHLPANRERDYFVTQVRLSNDQYGFITECSRYDFIESIKGFPTGACSGRMNNDQIGITMRRPLQH